MERTPGIKSAAKEDDLIRRLYYLPEGIDRLEKLGERVRLAANVELNVVDEIPDYCYLVKKGRVVCHELEAWYPGDLEAVGLACHKNFSALKNKKIPVSRCNIRPQSGAEKAPSSASADFRRKAHCALYDA